MCFLCRCAQQDVSTPFLYMLDLLNVAQQWTLLAPGSLSPYQHITGRRAAAVHFVMVETALQWDVVFLRGAVFCRCL